VKHHILLLAALSGCDTDKVGDSADPGFFDDIFGPRETEDDETYWPDDTETDPRVDTGFDTDTDTRETDPEVYGSLEVRAWPQDGSELFSSYSLQGTPLDCGDCTYAFDILFSSAEEPDFYGMFLIGSEQLDIGGYPFYRWYIESGWVGYAYISTGHDWIYLSNTFGYTYGGATEAPDRWPLAYNGSLYMYF